MADVSIFDVERGEPQRDRKGGRHRQQDENRNEEQPERERHAVPLHEDKEYGEREHEIDDAGQDRGDRHGEARKVDLRDQARAAHEAVGGLVHRVGKQRPRHERGICEHWIGKAVRGHPGQMAEKDGEDHHREERLDDRPGRAEHRLLVADLDVTPDEKVQELAVLPQVAELEGNPAARGLDPHRRRISVQESPTSTG